MPAALPDADPPSALPRGTRLGEFEIRRVLGVGGFGIVYLAFDHALEREVAIKEYMPGSLAGRSPATLEVAVLSQANAESFSLGLRSFVNEARLLARFDHPSLVKVHRYWEAHHTAYMAMPYYAGQNLQQVRRALREPPDEAWLRAIVEPLLGALARLHREGVYHRDISPDNVLIEPDGRPVLLDFGAARRVIGDKSMALTAILKPAYAPIEQYGEAGAVKQGPWTDLYALGATVHYLLVGRAPPPATTRTVHDDMPPLARQALPGCSERFLRCIDWMLQPRPADRPHQVADLVDALAGRREPPAADEPFERTQLMRRGGPAPSSAPPSSAPPPSPPPDAPPADGRATGPEQPDAQAWAPTAVAEPATAAPEIWIDGRAPASPGTDRTTTEEAPPPAPASRPLDAAPPVDPPAATPASAVPTPPRRSLGWRLPALVGAGVLVALALGTLWRSGPAPQAVPVAASSPAEAPAPASAPLATAEGPGPQASATAPPAMASAPGAVPAGPSPAATTPRPSSPATAGAANRPGNAAPTAPAAAASGAYRWPMLPPPPSPGTASHPGAATSPATSPATPATGTATAAGTTSAAAPAPHTTAPAPSVNPAAAGPSAGASRQGTPTAAVTPPPRAAAPAPAPVAAEADPDGEPMVMKARVLSPSERCEGRVLIARWACIERQCSRVPELRNHPECVKLRREAEQRNEPR
ncbi:protein kinase [Ideonella sp. DXS22W]|uniref:non-specific serine/threonine protein kinase n=1 Tax=Pseudaquabacterium inlustre TaxID=2984192 RepID=A0ABU9CI10_9BURK